MICHDVRDSLSLNLNGWPAKIQAARPPPLARCSAWSTGRSATSRRCPAFFRTTRLRSSAMLPRAASSPRTLGRAGQIDRLINQHASNGRLGSYQPDKGWEMLPCTSSEGILRSSRKRASTG